MRRAILAAILLVGVAAPAFGGPNNPESVQAVAPGKLGISRQMGWRGIDSAGNPTLPFAVHVYGQSPDSDAGELIWTGGDAFAGYLTTADELRVAAGGNAADIYSGVGAREIVIEGLDANWEPISESLLLMGAAASADTTQQFIRVNRAYVSFAGAYGTDNAAAITIETNAGSPIEVAIIPAGAGVTEQATYAVRDGYTAYLGTVSASSGVVTDLQVFYRPAADDVATPFVSRQRLGSMIGATITTSGTLYHPTQIDFQSMVAIPERSDIWVEGGTATTSGVVGVSFDLYMVPNPPPTPTPTPRPSPTPTPAPT